MIIYCCLYSLLDQILYNLLHGIRFRLNFNLPGTSFKFAISGFRLEVDENCFLLSYYAASSGNSLRTFRSNLSGPIFKCQESKKMGSKSCPETSVINYNYSLHNISEERSYNICFVCVEHGLFLPGKNICWETKCQQIRN
jgi:hypothetical protein